LATLTESGTTVSLEFHFNEVGEIIGIFTLECYREVNRNCELTPWLGHFSNYEIRKGMRIPVEGYVEWQIPTGSFSYWKGPIVEVEYKYVATGSRYEGKKEIKE